MVEFGNQRNPLACVLHAASIQRFGVDPLAKASDWRQLQKHRPDRLGGCQLFTVKRHLRWRECKCPDTKKPRRQPGQQKLPGRQP